ncbi:Proteasome assembly chaperone 2 [Carpediemonas membranifera]|uniref:Proteasome assembly chaperone 2 n=1 Tax=Carpediemonas membranifera TaxID=201153 RepID=A0A8J6DZX2_9EUKA|nr:Proteasome assembly chaperone 2 [Carpediemonas membranifera]|eukprot:KAG9394254.1 Proteasome assembly chaperone 2 [Carpediemonas membranifera]
MQFYGDNSRLNGVHTCIIPAIAHGGSAQLAIDMLVTTLGFQLAGRLLSDHVASTITVQPLEAHPLSTVTEVFVQDDVVVIQMRGPVLHQGPWSADLAAWLKQVGVRTVNVWSSVDRFARTDSQLEESNPIRHVGKNGGKIRRLEQLAASENTADIKKVVGTGNTARMVAAFAEAELECDAFFSFAGEGDNRAIARAFLDAIPMPVEKAPWREPESWEVVFQE